MQQHNEELTFATERGKLKGTYTPAGTTTPKAFLVFVPGSGPTTRDGIAEASRVKGMPAPFVTWATLLSQAGYASFRYDKRAATYARQIQQGELTCTGIADEYLDDLADVMELLKLQGFSHYPTLLMGHSLGALAALAYAQSCPDVTGVIAIGTQVENLIVTLKRQLRVLWRDEEYRKFVHTLDLVVKGHSNQHVMGLPPAYWRDYVAYALEPLLHDSQIRHPALPVLLAHGCLDPLVPVEQVRFLQQRLAHLPGVHWAFIEEGSHYLMTRLPTFIGEDATYTLSPIIDWLDRLVGL